LGHFPHSTAKPYSFDFVRFLEAQADMYAQAVQELRSGQKRSHWMWFIFPQINGLGTSVISCRYAIKSLQEAHEYLRHPVLGSRIIECTKIVNGLQGSSVRQIFGYPDDMKFCSSMTLFELASDSKSDFAFALEKYFAGERDAKTYELVGLAKTVQKHHGVVPKTFSPK
jgi:uncharacterized protein (DUF1810 family)